MATTSTSAVLSQANLAGYNAWVSEIITALFTTLGASQTADTGQTTNGGVYPTGANQSNGYVMGRFTDSLALGPIATGAITAGGSGYDAGGTHTYTAVPLTGGSGSGAQATVVVTSGVVTSVTITTAGTGYNGADSLSASNTNLGGSGSGFVYTVSTLTSGSPVVWKLEFGSGGAITTPQMWITIGQGSNGSGTLTGVTTTRCEVTVNGAPSSTSTSYVSRYCYNATNAIMWFAFKYNGFGATNATFGGLIIMRDSNSSGAPTGNSVTLITNSSTATGGVGSAPGSVQTYSFLTGALVSLPTNTTWSQWYYALLGTTYSGQVQVVPCVFLTPVLYVTNNMAIGIPGEEPIGNTASFALVGGTANTYLSSGNPFGANSNSYALAGLISGSYTLNLLWE